MKKEFYKTYWENQPEPKHSMAGDAGYENYADELNIILKFLNYNGGPVFEAGCGDGGMYPFLNIDHSNYKAKDLSKVMVDKFKKNHPSAVVEYGDGSVIPTGQQGYGLIFGYTVHHNFDRNMLSEHIKQASEVLQKGGILLIGGQPLKQMKYAYYSGLLTGTKDYSLRLRLYGLLSLLNITNGVRIMGHWHKLTWLKKQAKKNGLEYRAFGSVCYPYRFNIALQKK